MTMGIRETVAYLRQSLDRDNDEYGVDRQRAHIQELCDRRGWTVTREYIDNDESATPERRNGKPRPAYAGMFADAAAGRIERIVVAKTDRLYRHPRELEDIIDACKAYGVALATAHGDLDLSTEPGRLVARILGDVARNEIEVKSARHKDALSQRADRGEAWWASRPFGYTVPIPAGDGKAWSTKGQPIIRHPFEAALVRQAYADVLAGTSLYGIAKAWNDAGITTPKGNPWRGAQVRQLLLSARNAALRTYNGAIVGAGDWPPLVDRDIYDGVAAILADPARRSGKSRARVHLLSGLARCGKCGTPVKSARTSGRNIYTCRESTCRGVARVAAPLDRLIVGLVVERLSQPDAADLLVTSDPEKTRELRDRAKGLRAKLAESRQLYEDGVLDAHELRITRENVKAKLADVESRLNDTHRARVFDGLIDVEDVGEAFDALLLDRQRAVVDALLDITIQPAGHTGPRFRPDTIDADWRI
jgi:DNA invertase Pin-like site-specific DNA recombinase